MGYMARIKLVAFAVLLIVLLVSCDLLFPDLDRGDSSLNNLKDNEFYAVNMTNSRFYKVNAEKLYEGQKCVVWAEKDSGVTQEQARDFANEYDTIIRPRVVGAFSMKNVSTKDDEYTFADMLDYANWLTGGSDRKLTILLLDIKDGFKNSDTDPYVAGYFFGADLQPKGEIRGTGQYSNGRDMIYIDTYPGLEKKPEEAYATFAHELQHLINYVTRRGLGLSSLDTWIDEGLSSQAEYLCYGESTDKCEWFSEDAEGTIAKGNNFFVWDNHQDKRMAILDDYATVYLFFRWLYLQADADLQKSIFLEIVTSKSRNYMAVTEVAKKINSSWRLCSDLLETWLAANCYPENTTYGYKGNEYLQETIKVTPIAGSTVSLYPGEGVYSIINGSFSRSNHGYIKYVGLSSNANTLDFSSPYTGDILLTFNGNTSYEASPKAETGYLTGVTPPVSSSRMAGESGKSKKRGSYVIDARDLLGRDSW
jgi:hypothetical protein